MHSLLLPQPVESHNRRKTYARMIQHSKLRKLGQPNTSTTAAPAHQTHSIPAPTHDNHDIGNNNRRPSHQDVQPIKRARLHQSGGIELQHAKRPRGETPTNLPRRRVRCKTSESSIRGYYSSILSTAHSLTSTCTPDHPATSCSNNATLNTTSESSESRYKRNLVSPFSHPGTGDHSSNERSYPADRINTSSQSSVKRRRLSNKSAEENLYITSGPSGLNSDDTQQILRASA